MDVERIRTDEPRREQWRLLSQFAYPANIHAYNQQTRQSALDPATVAYIVSAIRQAQAFFSAAENAPLDISPVLTYYGATNLLSAVVVLRTGTEPVIAGHGMEVKAPITTRTVRIAEHQLIPHAGMSDGLAVYWRELSPSANIPGGAAWTLEEIFGSLPDLRSDFQNCYPDARLYTIPVQICQTPKIRFERVECSAIVGYATPVEAFSLVQDFSTTYLQPQIDGKSSEIVLHYKLGSKGKGTYSIFGQKHLQIMHEKGNERCNPDQIILMLMGLFALGHLSRYYPSLWNPFVVADETGEKLVIERFLSICQRYFPNLALNLLYGKRFQFVNETERPRALDTDLTEQELLRMLRDLRKKGETF